MVSRRPYKRTDRLGPRIQEVLAIALQRETRETLLRQVVVTEVQVTRDLSLARVYYYLMGGERTRLDIGHFPKLGRKLIFTGGAEVLAVEDAAVRRMSMAEWFPDGLPPGASES